VIDGFPGVTLRNECDTHDLRAPRSRACAALYLYMTCLRANTCNGRCSCHIYRSAPAFVWRPQSLAAANARSSLMSL